LGSEPTPGLAGDGLPVAALLAVKDRSVTAVLLSFQGTPLDPPDWRGLRPVASDRECRCERHSRTEAEVRASWLLLSAGAAGTAAPLVG